MWKNLEQDQAILVCTCEGLECFILTLTPRPGLVPDAGSLYPLSVLCLDPKLRMDKNLEKIKLHLKY